jgi:protein SCO1/2
MTVRRFEWMLFLLSLALLVGACAPPQSETSNFHGTLYPERPAAPDFILQKAAGGTFQLSRQVGTPVLLYFGYTHSPDVDPTTLYNMSWIFDKLSARPEYQVEFVMITVDPARDKPSELRRYLEAYDSKFVGLFGDSVSLQAVESAYGVTVQKKSSSGPGSQEYTLDHTSTVFVIDRQGRLVTRYPYGTEPETILSDLLYLLQES